MLGVRCLPTMLHLFVRSFVERELNAWHKLCRNQFNALKRERALKGKASDSDEKMMTVERSYHKGELLIQRSVEPVLLLVSFISIHRTSTFNLQSATKLLRHRTRANRVTSESKRILIPPLPLHSKLGCLLFSLGSSNIGTMLHGGNGGKKSHISSF